MYGAAYREFQLSLKHSFGDDRSSPIQLIYPTIIIILVTLERTHCENGFTFNQSQTDATAVQATQIELNNVIRSSESQGRSSADDACFEPDRNGDDTSAELKKAPKIDWKPPAIAV